MMKKSILKKEDNKRKKIKRGSLDDNEKLWLRKYVKKEKNAMRDNLHDEQKEPLKIEGNIRKKSKAW